MLYFLTSNCLQKKKTTTVSETCTDVTDINISGLMGKHNGEEMTRLLSTRKYGLNRLENTISI